MDNALNNIEQYIKIHLDVQKSDKDYLLRGIDLIIKNHELEMFKLKEDIKLALLKVLNNENN